MFAVPISHRMASFLVVAAKDVSFMDFSNILINDVQQIVGEQLRTTTEAHFRHLKIVPCMHLRSFTSHQNSRFQVYFLKILGCKKMVNISVLCYLRHFLVDL